MISYIRFENFYSFREPCEISFEVGKKPSASFYDLNTPSGERLNKVLAVVGANGAGKTQLLRPLAFLSWFIRRSYVQQEPDDKISFEPHALSQDENSELEIGFYLDDDQYRYTLVFNKQEVISEHLYVKGQRTFNYVFKRDLADGTYHYKEQGFGIKNRSQAQGVKKNASLISAAAVFGAEKAVKITELFTRLTTNLSYLGRHNYNENELINCGEFFAKKPEFKDYANDLICEMDLGISQIDIREITLMTEDGSTEEVHMPYARHKSADGEFDLPMLVESSGTKSAYYLLRHIIPVLFDGGIAVIDEIDNDLHPHMLEKILDLFKYEESNPHGAQLIFTCHTPEVLNILFKHQVYLVEKEDLVSDAWRLDSVVGLRADDNLYAKYQAGALQAVPNI